MRFDREKTPTGAGGQSRGEALYERLRAAILRGELQPNERLVEDALAASAAMSRTPVRWAIHNLEIDGLVKSTRRGVVVADFSAQEMVDLCVIRESLEGLASRLAAGSRSELELSALEGIMDQARTATASSDVGLLVELNHDFHETIWQASRNGYLSRQLGQLRSLIERMQTTTLSEATRQRESLLEHEAMLDAILSHDQDHAELITRSHFRAAMSIRLMNRRHQVRSA